MTKHQGVETPQCIFFILHMVIQILCYILTYCTCRRVIYNDDIWWNFTTARHGNCIIADGNYIGTNIKIEEKNAYCLRTIVKILTRGNRTLHHICIVYIWFGYHNTDIAQQTVAT